MSDVSHRTTWTVGLILAAASVAVVSGLYWWRMRLAAQERHVLRGVTEILSEFRSRMDELQTKLGSGPTTT